MTEKIYTPTDPENKRLEAILAVAKIINATGYDDAFKLELFKTIIAKCFD